MSQFSDNADEQVVAKAVGLVQSMVIELITAFSNANMKIRVLAEEAFTIIAEILTDMKASEKILQSLLVGLAGTSTHTQSCTIRALIHNMKNIISLKLEDSSKL